MPRPGVMTSNGREDEPHDSRRDVAHLVALRHRASPGVRSHLFDARDDLVAAEPGHHDAADIERLGALHRIPDRDRGKPEDRGLLADRSAVRNDAARRQLQPVVVEKAERFVKDDPVQLRERRQGRELAASPRVRRHQHRQVPFRLHGLKRLEQVGEPLRRVDVLLAVSADQKEFARLEIEPGKDIRGVDLVAIEVDDLTHGRSGRRETARVQSLGEQVAPGVFVVGQVEVGDMVDHPAIDLLRNVLVERSIARLHVIHGDVHPPGHHGGDRAVGVAENENAIGPDVEEHLLDLRQRVAEHGAEARGVDVEEMIRGANAQFFEKDLVQLAILVLARVDQNVVHRLVQPRDDSR